MILGLSVTRLLLGVLGLAGKFSGKFPTSQREADYSMRIPHS
jgi:hypothetical protein